MTQKEALDILKTGCNVYLTGSAGSGKTYVLQHFISYLKQRDIGVGITAPTGVAATHLNGQTIHSWAGIGIKTDLSDAYIADLLKRRYLHNRFKNTKVLIIDEVSMLPSETLEAADKVFKAFKNDERPFGGIQVVLSGDFFQLPPVNKEIDKTHFIYKSSIWKDLDLQVCYLDKPYRQDDEQFLHMLQEIRQNKVTRFTWDMLKDRFFHIFTHGETPTRLYTHNINADAINLQELAKIKEKEQLFHMRTVGNEVLTAMMKKSCLAPEVLVLKKRALVMFVKNNSESGYANGTMGRIVDFTEREGLPIVKTFSGKEIIVRPTDWIIEDVGEEKAKITQIPLRLAWAITIHKSQGMSLDAAEIDLGKSFVTGMGYVALSRVRTLQGIRLRSLNRTALSVNDEVIEMDKMLKAQSDTLMEELRKSSWYNAA